MNYTDLCVLEALETGTLSVNTDTGEVFRNGRRVGSYSHGYVLVYVRPGVIARAHRIVWLAAHGSIPESYQINHRNRVRDDNRLVNLEAVTRSQNILHANGSVYYEGVRPEDLADADPGFVAGLCSLLGIAPTDDPTVLARLLQDADTDGVEPPKLHEHVDDLVVLSPCGDWVQDVQRGVLVGGTRRRAA